MRSLFQTITMACVVSTTFAFAKDRVYTTDVVVVGAGSAGLAAAVSAAQHGAKVTVLEKMTVAGGSSNFAEGLFAIDTVQLRDKAQDISKPEFYKQIMEFNHYRTNAKLLKLAVEESTHTIEWLESNGIGFESIKMSYADSPVWHTIKDYKSFHHGAALVNRLLEVADGLGVKVMYEAPAKELIVDKGIVKGVEGVDAQGNKIIVKAGAVIIATGGFPNSKEMIAKYTRFDSEKIIGTLPLEKNGDGINMAMKVGAATEGWGLMLHQATRGPGVKPFGALFTMTWQPNLWVNKYAERFVDESVVFSFTSTGNIIERQPDSYAWAVFDQDAFDKYSKGKGIEAGIGVIIPIGTQLKDLKAEFEECEKAGNPNSAMADSIPDLARKMKVDPAKLATTIANYNSYKGKNLDSEFWTNPKWIQPVRNAKFYAVKIFPQAYVSLGGPKVNTSMETLDKNDQPIQGLYTVGCDVGGLYGDTYSLFASGSAFGFACTSGRLAGANAAAKVLGK